MSHRTRGLPPLTGVRHAIRELRYHEIARQLLAVVLILLYAVTARTTPFLAATGLTLALAGTLFRLYASGFIVKNKELATTGPYALVRHPLYTGNILVITGFAIANGTLWSLPLALVFFGFYYPPAIEYEDRKLHGLFKKQWEAWAQSVPALVPALDNVKRMGGGSWSFAKSTKRNGELVIAIYVLLCMGWVLRQVI